MQWRFEIIFLKSPPATFFRKPYRGGLFQPRSKVVEGSAIGCEFSVPVSDQACAADAELGGDFRFDRFSAETSPRSLLVFASSFRRAISAFRRAVA